MHSYYSHSQIEMYSASAPRGLVQLFMDKQICGTDLEYSLLYRALHKYPPPPQKKTFYHPINTKCAMFWRCK